MIKIDKNVPIPAITHRSAVLYPWNEMEIGDSFLMPKISNASCQAMKSTAGRKYGRKFSARKEGNGYRIWRVE